MAIEYNTIRTNRILPAFIENACEYEKIELYAAQMKENDVLTGENGFPPIAGYYDTVCENDIGNFFNTGSEIYEEMVTEKHLGEHIFRVTDGNHRFLAAVKAGIWSLQTELDKSGFVSISVQ